MALTNNLAVTLKDFPALKEALAQAQPGDKLRLSGVEVTIVENLPERASFDVCCVDSASSAAGDADDPPDKSALADSVLGVMSKKAK